MGLQNHPLACLVLSVILQARLQLVNGQALPVQAIVTEPVVNGTLGETATLSCGSLGVPLSLCLWERTNSERSNLILTFDTRARTGISSGLNGYNYIGESLVDGECGFRIDSVKEEDFKKWQCTLIADNKTFRGYAELRKSENVTEVLQNSTAPVGVQGSVSPIKPPSSFVPARQSRQFFQSAGSTSLRLPKGRPVVTVETVRDSDFSRSSPVEEIPVGLQVQEVQVQSSGLEIKQKKARKLLILS